MVTHDAEAATADQVAVMSQGQLATWSTMSMTTITPFAIPVAALLPAIGVSLVLAIATTWLPAQFNRRPMMENLRQPT